MKKEINVDPHVSVAFYTLGCKVNQYETQALKEEFISHGYFIVDEHETADIYVINTCTVTNLSDRKSRQYIRRMKKRNPESIVAVIGCYAQVNPDEVSNIAGVDLVVGNNEKSHLVGYIEEYIDSENFKKKKPFVCVLKREHLSDYEKSGLITSMESRTRAYIKIQDGCDQFCSYCIIPYARGPVRSRPLGDIIKEAQNLIAKGFKELVLTGINAALYGSENNISGSENTSAEPEGIESVIKALNQLDGDFRIRLGSLEPTVADAQTVGRLLAYEKLCRHMHLSLQSGSDDILKAMNRNYDRDGYLKIVKVLREADEDYGITTDIIVGFPGETDEDFKKSKDLVQRAGFVKTHVFPYSKREGTKAARMENQIDGRVKKIRSVQLMDAAERSAEGFIKASLGKAREVLFEEYDSNAGLISGYSDNYIKVYVKVEREDSLNDTMNSFKLVKLTELYSDGAIGIIM